MNLGTTSQLPNSFRDITSNFTCKSDLSERCTKKQIYLYRKDCSLFFLYTDILYTVSKNNKFLLFFLLLLVKYIYIYQLGDKICRPGYIDPASDPPCVKRFDHCATFNCQNGGSHDPKPHLQTCDCICPPGTTGIYVNFIKF